MKKLYILLLYFIIPFLGLSQSNNSTTTGENNLSDQFNIPNDKIAIGVMIENKKKTIDRNIRKKDVVIALIGEAEFYKKSVENISSDPFSNLFLEIDKLLVGNNLDPNERNKLLTQKAEKVYSDLSIFYPGYYKAQNYDFPELLVDKLKNESENINRELANNIYSLVYDSERRPIILTKSIIDNLKIYLDTKSLEKLKKNLLDLANSEIQRLNAALLEINKQLEKDSSDLILLQKKLTEQETHIDDLAIKIGLPLFCLTILLLFLGPKILNLFDKYGSIDPKDNSSQSVLLEISTVLLLTMSILILGLSGKIQSDVLGTLIGGISGYVLNRIGASQKTSTDGKLDNK